MHLVDALDVLFGGFDFLALFHPLTAPKKWFFGRVFLLFEFVPRIIHLQFGAGELKLSMYIY